MKNGYVLMQNYLNDSRNAAYKQNLIQMKNIKQKMATFFMFWGEKAL